MLMLTCEVDSGDNVVVSNGSLETVLTSIVVLSGLLTSALVVCAISITIIRDIPNAL